MPHAVNKSNRVGLYSWQRTYWPIFGIFQDIAVKPTTLQSLMYFYFNFKVYVSNMLFKFHQDRSTIA